MRVGYRIQAGEKLIAFGWPEGADLGDRICFISTDRHSTPRNYYLQHRYDESRMIISIVGATDAGGARKVKVKANQDKLAYSRDANILVAFPINKGVGADIVEMVCGGDEHGKEVYEDGGT